MLGMSEVAELGSGGSEFLFLLTFIHHPNLDHFQLLTNTDRNEAPKEKFIMDYKSFLSYKQGCIYNNSKNLGFLI
jgi:hypothetical protein